MQLDLNVVATRLGMAILEKMAADFEVQQLQDERHELLQQLAELHDSERGEADVEDGESDGHQGA